MNQYQLKEALVNRYIYLIILFFILISCTNSTSNKINDDYLIINKAIESSNLITSNKTLELNSNNEYVILILNKLYKNKKDNHIKILDSIKQDIGITKGDPILDSIFNLKQYEYLISQKNDKYQWNLDLINKLPKIGSVDRNNLETISISKPIYTLDKKLALVGIMRKTSMGISVYKKTNQEWTEHKMIAPIITQPKAEKFNYD